MTLLREEFATSGTQRERVSIVGLLSQQIEERAAAA
jgi:hypothetical protein